MGTAATVVVDLDPPSLEPNHPFTDVRATDSCTGLIAVSTDSVRVEFTFDTLDALIEWADGVAATGRHERASVLAEDGVS